MLFKTPLFTCLLALPAAIRSAPIRRNETSAAGYSAGSSKSDYISNAMAAVQVLNDDWYHAEQGLWEGCWWNSASALTTIADLAQINSDFMDTATGMFAEIFINAKASNPTNAGSWLNNWYDDESWWAMAWIKVYDVTGNGTYLSASESIFEDLLTGLGATCGGQWWDKTHKANNAINNELLIAVAASLANRVQGKQSYYQDHAVSQAKWFLNLGLMSENNTFFDHVNCSSPTCEAQGPVFTYNQGVIIGALIELSKTTGDDSYLDTATKVAKGTVGSLVDSNGILTEVNDYPTNDYNGDQFKGIFARNLAALQSVRADESYVTLLTKSADSLWSQARSGDGRLAPNWQGPATNFGSPSQSSAADGLIAAASVSS